MSVVMKILLSTGIGSFVLTIISEVIADTTLSDWLEKFMWVVCGLSFTTFVISTIGVLLTWIWGW